MNKPHISALGKPVSRMRGMTVRGLATGSDAIDRAGGKYAAGIIKGFAVVTRGEAQGHGVWLDTAFVRQTRMALNALKRGAKSRFTHPGLSADGMGKLLGRAYRAKEDGDLVRSDLHFSATAHKAPDGDLASYVMDLAQEDPEAFGSSIVYMPDFDAERDFFLKHGGKFIQDPYYGEIPDASEFKSPDPLNEKNLPHARLQSLHAVDIVDEPAANPSGMFGRDPIFADAEGLMRFVAGLDEQTPKLTSLSVDPRRVTYFFNQFLDRHGLALTAKAPETNAMPFENAPNTNPAPTEPIEKTYTAGDLKRFRDAFGDQGTDWLLAGKSYEEAEKLHAAAQITKLGADIEALKKASSEQLAAVTKERDELQAKFAALSLGGEKDPVSFGGAESAPKSDKPVGTLPAGLQRFATAIKFAKN